MEDVADIGHGAAHRRRVAEIALDEVDVDAGKMRAAALRAHQRPNGDSPLQPARVVTAEPTKPLAPVTSTCPVGVTIGFPGKLCRRHVYSSIVALPIAM